MPPVFPRKRSAGTAGKVGATTALALLGAAPGAEAMLPAEGGGGGPVGPSATEPEHDGATGSQSTPATQPPARPPAAPTRSIRVAEREAERRAEPPPAAPPPPPARSIPAIEHQAEQDNKPPRAQGHPTRSIRVAEREAGQNSDQTPDVPEPRTALEELLITPLETGNHDQPPTGDPQPEPPRRSIRAIEHQAEQDSDATPDLPEPRTALEKLLIAPLETGDADRPPSIGKKPDLPKPQTGLEELLYAPLTGKGKPAVTPEAPPEELDHLKPYERDIVLTGVASPYVTEGQVEGARRRLQGPTEDMQWNIDGLQDRIEDLEVDANPTRQLLVGPMLPEGQAIRENARLDRLKGRLDEEQIRMELYTNGNCDYRCDIDAPYEKKNGDPDDPYDVAADSLGAGATRAEVVHEAARLAEVARKKAAEQAEQDAEDAAAAEESGSGGHLALDGLGFAGPIGPFADAGNAIWHAAEGNWGEAGWSTIGIVPLAGDAVKAVKLGKRGANALDAVHDAENVVNAANGVRRADDPATLADNFIADSRLQGKLDDSVDSRSAMEDIFRRTSSGTPANTLEQGRFIPSHTRGHTSELRTVMDLAGRGDVHRITPVPSASGSRTPDFVVTRADGTTTRVEVTTVTGAGPGYQARGLGAADTPSPAQVRRALRGKVTPPRGGGTTQFDADLPGVPTGGTLAVHLRGADAATAADRALTPTLTRQLANAKVDSVEFYLPGGKLARYARQADGTYKIQP